MWIFVFFNTILSNLGIYLANLWSEFHVECTLVILSGGSYPTMNFESLHIVWTNGLIECCLRKKRAEIVVLVLQIADDWCSLKMKPESIGSYNGSFEFHISNWVKCLFMLCCVVCVDSVLLLVQFGIFCCSGVW